MFSAHEQELLEHEKGEDHQAEGEVKGERVKGERSEQFN